LEKENRIARIGVLLLSSRATLLKENGCATASLSHTVAPSDRDTAVIEGHAVVIWRWDIGFCEGGEFDYARLGAVAICHQLRVFQFLRVLPTVFNDMVELFPSIHIRIAFLGVISATRRVEIPMVRRAFRIRKCRIAEWTMLQSCNSTTAVWVHEINDL